MWALCQILLPFPALSFKLRVHKVYSAYIFFLLSNWSVNNSTWFNSIISSEGMQHLTLLVNRKIVYWVFFKVLFFRSGSNRVICFHNYDRERFTDTKKLYDNSIYIECLVTAPEYEIKGKLNWWLLMAKKLIFHINSILIFI